MGIFGKLKLVTRDRSYDQRKVLNSDELLKTAQHFGLTYDQIGKLCGVSKTMVSNWGNPNNKSLPSRSQIDPLLREMGYGRFDCKLEALSSYANEYPKGISSAIGIILICMMLIVVWYLCWKPCTDNWEECSALPWYQMPIYVSYKTRQNIEEYREYKKLKVQDGALYQ